MDHWWWVAVALLITAVWWRLSRTAHLRRKREGRR